MAHDTTTSAWTFTQGLLVGQGIFLLLCLLFIRYVVFSSPSIEDNEARLKRRKERAEKAFLSTTAVPPPPTAELLDKTGYDMSSHAAESADWINVLGAQVLQGYRNDLLSSGGEEGARKQFERWLNPPGRELSWLDPIEVTSVHLGSSFPLLSNARIRPADGDGRVRVEVDLDYADSVSLAISTAVLINFPRPRFAVLPVAIRVELVSFGGTLSVQIHDPRDEQQHMHVCLLPDFSLNLKTSSLLGSRAKLQDIPKIEQLLVERLRAVIQDRIVYPRHLTFALPRLLSRSAPEATPIVPSSTDLRSVAMHAMSQGISRLGQDLAGRVAALAPADSASVAGGVAADSPTVDSAAEAEYAESESMAVPQSIPAARRLPPAYSGNANDNARQRQPPGVVSAVSSNHASTRAGTGPMPSVAATSSAVRAPLSSNPTNGDLRHRQADDENLRRLGALNSRG